ncbi:pirin family protein [Streptomyces sp. NPDC002309]
MNETQAEATVEILSPRDVPLGGPRAMTVRRTLPQRSRSLIGAWCFADYYGPDEIALTGGMDVAPHPHIGLQTVSWLFKGEIEHRDSLGTLWTIRPGELNLMTGGHGICHSEVSTPSTDFLHGVQLWVALPDQSRDTGPDFHHYVPRTTTLDGGAVKVFLGSLAGDTSPVTTFTPLLGAELRLDPGATVTLPVDPAFEHGLLLIEGDISMAGTRLSESHLGYLPSGRETLTVTNHADAPAVAMFLGGPPFGEEILMWWNFVGRTQEDIEKAREDWMNGTRFGEVVGYPGEPLPAPGLPRVPMKPRS